VSPRKPILREITVVGGVASSTILTTLDVPYTAGLVNDDGTLWGGKWDSDMNLYTIDPANGQFTVQYDLSTVPGLESMSGINGLSPVVPEPMTMLAFGSAVAGIGGYIRRRRRA
jgi:outer membrane protein assembly factor BamB